MGSNLGYLLKSSLLNKSFINSKLPSRLQLQGPNSPKSAQNHPKPHFLFHENNSPRDFTNNDFEFFQEAEIAEKKLWENARWHDQNNELFNEACGIFCNDLPHFGLENDATIGKSFKIFKWFPFPVIFKTRQTVAGTNMISQFHEFFDLILMRTIDLKELCT